MIEADRKKRNAERLAELHPWMRARVVDVIARLEAKGRRPRIQEAWRSIEDQAAAKLAGYSGVSYGYHNVTGPGGAKESFAVDLLDDDDPLDRDLAEAGSVYYLMLAEAAQKCGLQSLILWGLAPDARAATMLAITAGAYNAHVRIGKDPTHIEPGQESGITIDRLKMGWRPLAIVPKTMAAPATEPTPTLEEASALTGRLGKLPAPHEIGLSQLESHWRLLSQLGDNMASMQQETREALENAMPRYIMAACRKRMLDRAVEAGISDVNMAHGYYRRVFHGEPIDAGDVRQLLHWWLYEVRR